MAEGAEVARAVVTLIPSMKGSQETITNELTGAGKTAGSTVGEATGKSMVSSISSSMSSAGASLTKGLTVPLLAVGTASVAAATSFDTSFSKLTTIADTSEVSVDNLKRQIMDLSSETGMSASAVAEAAYSAISAGQDTGDALQFVATSAKLAKGGFTDVSTATDVLTTALNAYGMEASEATHVSDVLIATQNRGKTTVAELGSAMGRVIPTASAAGVSIEDLASQYVALTKNGIGTAEATTYINGMLNELTKSGSSANKAFKEAAGVTFPEYIAAGHTTAEAMRVLAEYEEEAGKKVTDAFGSAEAGKAANVLVGHTEDAIEAFEEMTTVAGQTQAAFETMDQTSAAKLEKLKTSVSNIAITLGDSILPALEPVITSLAKVITTLSEGFASLPEPVQTAIVTLGGVALVAGPILSTGSKIITAVTNIKGAFGGLVSTMSDVSSKFGGFTGLMGSSVGDLTSTIQGKLGVAGAAIGVFLGTFKLTSWILEITGAKDALEEFGESVYDFFHKGQDESVSCTNAAMQAFEDYAFRGEGTYEQVLQQLQDAQKKASETNTEITRQDAETLQTYIDMMENGVAQARANEAQARQLANETLIAENEMTAETLQATMDLANQYLETGAGNAETIMANLQTAYEQYAASTDETSQATAAEIQVMMDEMATAMGATSETMALVAGEAAENLTASLAQANEYLETGRGDTEAIIANLQSAYETYKDQTGDYSDEVETSVNDMVSAVESASGVSISATGSMEAETVADLDGIAQAMDEVGSSDMSQFESAIESGASSVESSFAAMEGNISSSMANAEDTITSAISEIEEAFANAKLSFEQHINLPHFSMSGRFNAETGEVPSVSVSWYKKAAEEGALFTDPTLIGVGDANQPEMLIGEQTLYENIAKAMAENSGGGNITIPVYIGREHIQDIVIEAQQIYNYRSGGR